MVEEMNGSTDWIKDHIESREVHGKEWGGRLDEHEKLVKDARYIRILGRGFRPVSLSDDNPCGRLQYESGIPIEVFDSLDDAIQSAREASKTEYKPRIDKPEHRLQAFLIKKAIQNKLLFPPAILGCVEAVDELVFVTDEFSMQLPKQLSEKGIRADIIAVGKKGESYFPVFIELKNGRQLTRLKEQLYNARKWLWHYKPAQKSFAAFLSAVSGRPVEIDKEALLMIIWPKSTSGREANAVKKARQEGFIIVDFEVKYSFS